MTEEVGKHAIKGELSAEDGKKVLQQIFNLSCNYADQLKNFKETGKFEGTMNLIDDWDFFAAVDILNTAGNTMVFSDEFKQLFPPELKQQITSETVTITDKNGNQIPLIILRDNATGDIRVSFTLDKDGKIIMLPKDFGTKTLTVVDRQGRRHTKTVIVDKDKPTEVEIDLEELEEEDVTVLEDEPENGYIYLQPGSIYDKYGLSGTEEVRVRTNYLYYKAFADQESKWLSAKERSDMSQVVITYAANDTGEQRQGKVYVVCTNKEGKVLKQEVIKVTQTPRRPQAISSGQHHRLSVLMPKAVSRTSSWVAILAIVSSGVLKVMIWRAGAIWRLLIPIRVHPPMLSIVNQTPRARSVRAL